jgi:acetyl esterase/lipase
MRCGAGATVLSVAQALSVGWMNRRAMLEQHAVVRSCVIASTIPLLTVAVLAGRVTGQEPTARAKMGPVAVPKGVKAERNLDYAGDGLVRHRLDLFVPERPGGPWPLVVWVHGGAWRTGSKDGSRALGLSARGFAVASINYRLVDAGPFPLQIQDCRAAIRWLRANAAKYNLAPDRIGAWGASAGGHLVALLGTAGDQKAWDTVGEFGDSSARVQAVCDFFGHTDFVSLVDSDRPFPPSGPITALLGGPPRDNRDVAEAASPVTFVSNDDPPFLIVHGDHDHAVPLAQSKTLADKLKQAGVEVTLVVVKNGQHGLFDPIGDPDPASVNETVAAFFEKHLKPPKSPATAGSGK